MCTILTANNTIPAHKIIEQLKEDAWSNPDGFAMLMVQKNGKPLFIQSLDIEPILSLIEYSEFERIFVHTRYATQGKSALQNCHGWQANGVYVFHNGSIRSRISDKFDVDSEAIRYWLDNYGIDETIDKLIDEPFANVFLVDIEQGQYIVQRSRTGSLFTDGNGNYSTHDFDAINIPLAQDSLEQFELDVENTNEISSRFDSRYSNHNNEFNSTLESWDLWEKSKKAIGE